LQLSNPAQAHAQIARMDVILGSTVSSSSARRSRRPCPSRCTARRGRHTLSWACTRWRRRSASASGWCQRSWPWGKIPVSPEA